MRLLLAAIQRHGSPDRSFNGPFSIIQSKELDMSRTQVFGKTAFEIPRARTVEMKLDVLGISVLTVKNSAREATTLLALAAALLTVAASQAGAQNCPPRHKIAAGACVQSCPGGYEDTGRICVYRRQGAGGGS
jgi:hypothetical protein